MSLQSDFFIHASRVQESSDSIPMVLDNCFNPCGMQYNYLGRPWNRFTVIPPDAYVDIPPEQRVLPTTDNRYPWLTADDFLQPVCVELGYEMNSKCFFDGKLQFDEEVPDNNRPHFLIPLKPLFFKYFTTEDLRGTTDNGKPIFEMVYNDEFELVALLRIPVSKTDEYGRHAYITFRRVYKKQPGIVIYDPDNYEGTLLKATDGISVFPFVRLPSRNHYNIQHISTVDGISLSSLTFYEAGKPLATKDVRTAQRRKFTDDSIYATSYYSVFSSFDVLVFDFTVNNKHFNALMIPLWPKRQSRGGEAFTFAVDFGTTNTHIECLVDDRIVPLSVNSEAKTKFVATSYALNENTLFFSGVQEQEFLPNELGSEYRFPQRTVLSQSDSENSTNSILPLGDVNIPFIYEKKQLFFNKIIPGLKWSNDSLNEQYIKAFLTELALIMRSKVIMDNGNLQRTRIVWFYPLSMDMHSRSQISYIWKQILSDLYGININSHDERNCGPQNNLIEMPESVAPYYYHRDSPGFRASTKPSVSIDIGGGTCDTAVYVPSNGTQRLPSIITSFRFAANTVFGDAYFSQKAEDNPMITKYVKLYRDIYDRNKHNMKDPVLEDIYKMKKSEDICAFLFAVGDKKQNEEYSFNKLLQEDKDRKIVFIYFYAAIAYYVANLLKAKNVALPRHFFFSGTGSKILDILGPQEYVNQLTKDIIEAVYGTRTYEQAGYDFSVLTCDEPKQITCRGALQLLQHDFGMDEVKRLNEILTMPLTLGYQDEREDLKYRHTMIADYEKLTYGDIIGSERESIQSKVVDAVRIFNDVFKSLVMSKNWAEVFEMTPESIQIFNEHINDELDEYYFRFVECFVPKDANPQQEYEDIPFFYPIAGAIRLNLIAHIK